MKRLETRTGPWGQLIGHGQQLASRRAAAREIELRKRYANAPADKVTRQQRRWAERHPQRLAR